MKRLVGFLLAAAGGGTLLWALINYLGPEKGPMFGYDPVFAGLAAIAVLTFGLVLSQN